MTVTHPEIIRYFMSIPEAAELVIQAGAMAEGGDVFVLDMGEPVRIDDLARLMVRLSGFDVRTADNPEGDIAITYTGLRSGEKLYEELLIGANTKATEHPRIWRSDEPFLPSEELERELEMLKAAMNMRDLETMQAVLMRTVEGYQSKPVAADGRGKPARGVDAADTDAALTWRCLPPHPSRASSNASPSSARPARRCSSCATCSSPRSSRVIIACSSWRPSSATTTCARWTRLGAEHALCAPDANGLKLFSDWKAIGGLKQVLTAWSPQQSSSPAARKTMIYGALAAKSAGAERVVLVVDALPEHRFSGALAADEMPAWRYGQALRAADEAVFHNRDDLALLKKLGARSRRHCRSPSCRAPASTSRAGRRCRCRPSARASCS